MLNKLYIAASYVTLMIEISDWVEMKCMILKYRCEVLPQVLSLVLSFHAHASLVQRCDHYEWL